MLKVLAPASGEGRPPPASLRRRGAAALADVAIFGCIGSAVVFYWGQPLAGGGWYLHGVAALALLLLVPVYWIGFESMFGASPGKLLFGMRALALDGTELSGTQVTKRLVAKFAEAPLLWLPSAWFVRTTPLRQSFGDLWAETFVVETAALARWRSGADGRDFDTWLSSFPKAGGRTGGAGEGVGQPANSDGIARR